MNRYFVSLIFATLVTSIAYGDVGHAARKAMRENTENAIKRLRVGMNEKKIIKTMAPASMAWGKMRRATDGSYGLYFHLSKDSQLCVELGGDNKLRATNIGSIKEKTDWVREETGEIVVKEHFLNFSSEDRSLFSDLNLKDRILGVYKLAKEALPFAKSEEENSDEAQFAEQIEITESQLLVNVVGRDSKAMLYTVSDNELFAVNPESEDRIEFRIRDDGSLVVGEAVYVRRTD